MCRAALQAPQRAHRAHGTRNGAPLVYTARQVTRTIRNYQAAATMRQQQVQPNCHGAELFDLAHQERSFSFVRVVGFVAGFVVYTRMAPMDIDAILFALISSSTHFCVFNILHAVMLKENHIPFSHNDALRAPAVAHYCIHQLSGISFVKNAFGSTSSSTLCQNISRGVRSRLLFLVATMTSIAKM